MFRTLGWFIALLTLTTYALHSLAIPMGTRYYHILRLRLHRFYEIFYMSLVCQAHGFVVEYSNSGTWSNKL